MKNPMGSQSLSFSCRNIFTPLLRSPCAGVISSMSIVKCLDSKFSIFILFPFRFSGALLRIRCKRLYAGFLRMQAIFIKIFKKFFMLFCDVDHILFSSNFDRHFIM